MGKINDYKNRDKYHDGQPNTVLSVAEVKRYAVRYTDSEGKETMCLVDAFGKLEDGQLGVFIIANAREMTERLRSPGVKQLAQIREKIANMVPEGTEETARVIPGVTAAFDDVVSPGEGT